MMTTEEQVQAALNAKPFDDGDESVQYILLRGLSAIGFKLPAHATLDVMQAALNAANSASPTSVLTLTSEALSEAIAVMRRLETHAPDVGVDEFQDALRDARRLIAKADGC